MEFIHVDKFTVPPTMPVVYILLIFVFVLKKNVDRWFNRNWKKRKGELYLVGWWIAMLMMYIIQFETHDQYRVPPKMIETCILILLPYGVNTISKVLHTQLKSGVKHKRKTVTIVQQAHVKAR